MSESSMGVYVSMDRISSEAVARRFEELGCTKEAEMIEKRFSAKYLSVARIYTAQSHLDALWRRTDFSVISN